MTSKTFKNAEGYNIQLSVSKCDGMVEISILYPNGDEHTTSISPSDAPALALAILEAAGVTETDSPYMQEAADNLRAYILIEEKVAAEAKEQAELEAEALELLRASQCIRTDGMYAYVPSFAELSDPSKTKWLAVARKAREMAKDATE
ncbi:hypothetical protein [Glutamicibacter sp. AOP5-A2-18]|uniref:hypothetical protein n=1 Tax=Glutamicibacter sp. AOP5-A2-18 TaxID=3457656 RepID=UPI0040349746